MKPFTVYTGTTVPLMRDNIDTDQLIPKQYLKSTEKNGFEDYLFDSWRYNDDRSLNMEFVLNKPEYKKATILIAGDNFGCGSSREHAAWALENYGFRVVVAGSYSGIFYMNWLSNGCLPITLAQQDREELASLLPDEEIEVNLYEQVIKTAKKNYPFTLEESWRQRLLAGKDAIDITLDYEQLIAAYEEKMPEFLKKSRG